MSVSDPKAQESMLDTLSEPPPRGLFTRLSRVSLHLARLQDESIRELNMPYSDFTILNTLRRFGDDGGLPVMRLGRLVMRPNGSISLILDRLEKAGLVERRPDPRDRRSVLIALTSEGEQTSKRCADAYDSIQARTLERVEPAELGEIDGAVRRLLEILEDEER